MPQVMSMIGVDSRNPLMALVLRMILASTLLLTSDGFLNLLNFLVFISTFDYLLTIVALIKLKVTKWVQSGCYIEWSIKWHNFYSVTRANQACTTTYIIFHSTRALTPRLNKTWKCLITAAWVLFVCQLKGKEALQWKIILVQKSRQLYGSLCHAKNIFELL